MSKRSGCKFLALVAGLGLSVLGATSAQAGFTTVGAPNYGKGGEATQAQILSASYGGTFTANGNDLTNGSITATRLDDSTDQTFGFSITSSKALASFAAYNQGFGYGSRTSPTVLFNVGGDNYTVTGSTGAVSLPSSYAFVRTGKGFNQSSNNSENLDGVDHMVTYLLTGSSIKQPTYVLFFEDKTVGQHSDFDFNDLAVEVKTGGTAVVPLPAAAWSGLLTLAGGAVVAGYRKSRRVMA